MVHLIHAFRSEQLERRVALLRRGRSLVHGGVIDESIQDIQAGFATLTREHAPSFDHRLVPRLRRLGGHADRESRLRKQEERKEAPHGWSW